MKLFILYLSAVLHFIPSFGNSEYILDGGSCDDDPDYGYNNWTCEDWKGRLCSGAIKYFPAYLMRALMKDCCATCKANTEKDEGGDEGENDDPCAKKTKRKCRGECEFVDLKCRTVEGGEDNDGEKGDCNQSKKQKCYAEKGCFWKKGSCREVVVVKYDCGLIGSAKGDKIKKGKGKVNNDCECMEFCQNIDDAAVYSFKRPKEEGKTGLCLCYENMTKFKCSSKLISGLVEGEKDGGKAFLEMDGVKQCKQK